jgi:hypothetical protein
MAHCRHVFDSTVAGTKGAEIETAMFIYSYSPSPTSYFIKRLKNHTCSYDCGEKKKERNGGKLGFGKEKGFEIMVSSTYHFLIEMKKSAPSVCPSGLEPGRKSRG